MVRYARRYRFHGHHRAQLNAQVEIFMDLIGPALVITAGIGVMIVGFADRYNWGLW